MSPEELTRRLAGRGAPIRHLYLHLPFCERICPYCDFTTAVGAGADAEAFLASLEREMGLLADAGVTGFLRLDGGTLFLGGGTPSWFPPGELERLLGWLGALAPGPWAEATLEMNPEHADADRLGVLREGGITRLSLGAQSLTPSVLRRLGRVHTPDQVHDALRASLDAGFGTSVDMIFAVPGQEMAEWRRDVEGIVRLQPHHISLYNLTFEPGTPFTRWRAAGRIRPPGEEWEEEAYTWAAAYLRSAGYLRYEVSNFALPGEESAHNRAYWSGADYLGIGPSAHSLLAGVRTANVSDLPAWSQRVAEREVPWDSVEVLDQEAIARERVLLGLRTDRGVGLGELPERCRDAVERNASEAVAGGFARWVNAHGEGQAHAGGDRRLVLTERGMLLADELAVRIAP